MVQVDSWMTEKKAPSVFGRHIVKHQLLPARRVFHGKRRAGPHVERLVQIELGKSWLVKVELMVDSPNQVQARGWLHGLRSTILLGIIL